MIAVQLYTVRDHLRDPSRMGDVLNRLREAGYRAVEVAGLDASARQRFGGELADAGLVACAAHVSIDRITGDLDAVAGECKEWGCGYVVVPSLPDTYRSEDGYLRFAAEAVEIAARLRKFGLGLAYHNHSHELERFGHRTALEALFEATSPETLLAELDTYWLQHGGANPAAWIRRFDGRVPLVHLKDMAIVRGRVEQVEVGEGNLDWADILSACGESGTRWLVVEQDDTRGDPVESVAISYRNLARLTGETASA